MFIAGRLPLIIPQIAKCLAFRYLRKEREGRARSINIPCLRHVSVPNPELNRFGAVVSARSAKESQRKMTDEATNKIIELLLTDSTAGLKAYAALTAEEKEQVLEKAQDERINQIVAEADAESITD